MVIVKTPDAVGAGGLEVVCTLDFPHQSDVPRENEKREAGECRRWKDGKAVQAKEPNNEIEFMARTIINAGAVAEGVVEVCRDFGYCRRGLQAKQRVP